MIISPNVAGLSWLPTFLVDLPIGLATLAIAWSVLKRDKRRASAHLNLVGVALVSAALLLLFVPLIEGREAGWPAWTFASLGGCVLAIAAFLVCGNVTAHDAVRKAESSRNLVVKTTGLLMRW